MALFKCKMCGGELNITDGATIVKCEYCEITQTVPKIHDESVLNLFNRANHLRIKCEFDKAEDIYRKIINENPDESEGYWGLVLCKFGIEYVEDPTTSKRVPTCHRASFEAVTTDVDYLSAIEHADSISRANYEEAAKEIDKIQKDILAVVRNEKPFDVFICYKETDKDGKRTHDSVIANDIYHQLTQEGFKVFYAAITLEDKIGEKYEPYIFSALNSAKVMLVLGTRPEFFTAVWVKNEWSRFLKLMKSNTGKLLIPCFRDMDAYDLPEEFSLLQAQDMSKIGFIADLVRGIKKVVGMENASASAAPTSTPIAQEKVVIEQVTNAAAEPLLERGFMALEDCEWDNANNFFEQALNIDAKLAEAYLGKLMADFRVRTDKELGNLRSSFDGNNNYAKILRFGDAELKSRLSGYLDKINRRIKDENDRRAEEEMLKEEARLEKKYTEALGLFHTARSEDAFNKAASMFRDIISYKDSKDLSTECIKKASHYRTLSLKYHSAYPLASEKQRYISQRDHYLKLYQSACGAQSNFVGPLIGALISGLIFFNGIKNANFDYMDDELIPFAALFLIAALIATIAFIFNTMNRISLKFKCRSYMEQAETCRMMLERINSYPSFEAFVVNEEKNGN